MKSSLYKIIGYLTFFFCAIQATGQDVQFSYYNYTPLIVNPAQTGTDTLLTLIGGYKNQWSSIDTKFQTPILSGTYPLINKSNQLKGGIGLSILNDKTGAVIKTNTTMVQLTYSYNLQLNTKNYLSLGAGMKYMSKKLNADQALTESQYIPNVGIDENISNGEIFTYNPVDYLDLSAGMMFYGLNADKFKKYTLGFTLNHLNAPNNSFYGEKVKMPFQMIGHGSYLLLTKKAFHLSPEILYNRFDNQQKIITGLQMRYFVQNNKSDFLNDISLSFDPKYSLNDALILGVSVQKKSLTLGFAYDYTLQSVKNFNRGRGGTEFFVKYTISRKKTKTSSVANSYQIGQARTFINKTEEEKDNTKGFTLHLKEVIYFSFNDTTLADSSKVLINDVASLMKGNKYLKIKIIGHSDNLGTPKRNHQISVERAERVAAYLNLSGIPKNRIKIIGKGSDEPLFSNETEQGRSANRRVEFEIYK